MIAFPDNALHPGVPMPEQNRAVLRPRGDVAVRGDVALRAGQARDHAVMPEDDLDDLGGLGREHPEGVVPEAASQDEPTVHRHHEAVGAHADLLAEIIAEMALHLMADRV